MVLCFAAVQCVLSCAVAFSSPSAAIVRSTLLLLLLLLMRAISDEQYAARRHTLARHECVHDMIVEYCRCISAAVSSRMCPVARANREVITTRRLLLRATLSLVAHRWRASRHVRNLKRALTSACWSVSVECYARCDE